MFFIVLYWKGLKTVFTKSLLNDIIYYDGNFRNKQKTKSHNITQLNRKLIDYPRNAILKHCLIKTKSQTFIEIQTFAYM